MKKVTDFSRYISDFISRYLPNQRRASPNTIAAYRDTFVLLIEFIETTRSIKVEKLMLEHITKKTIIHFLSWLEKERKCSNSTQNARLAAIHAFYKFLQYEDLAHLYPCQKILSIHFKSTKQPAVNYLTIEGIKLLLKQPNIHTKKGRRDLALLSLMYDTGARVQELIDLSPSMLHLGSPATIKIIGKGNKARLVPMLEAQTIHLKQYMRESGLDNPAFNTYPLFYNHRKEKFTRAGINYLVKKYMNMARKENSLLIPNNMSCHSLRHSKAMHLLQAGVNLIYIRDILGHVSVQTTEIYARADSKQKRQALEAAYVNLHPDEEPLWENNENLVSWLKKF
ncbi:site-specific integrase [Chondrinema litorale]|uniref:site-specific integrase n=1 Tax=Chondrinema litorale TaxID=2994555 RepID=UPI002543ABBE|nr:site-specific integrase [Chondrinema litorale]UZR99082.1 site-specific integrase [Chondrinema litorale]